MRRLSIALACLLALCLAPPASAGEIHPDLAATLDRARPTDVVGALVILADQADIAALDRSLTAGHVARRVRHESVVRALRDMADLTQPDFLAGIGPATAAGEVRTVKPMWIVNAVGIEGTPAAIRRVAARADVATAYPAYAMELIAPVRVGTPRTMSSTAAEVEPGLTVTGAPELWAMGIDGTGALVCDMDTGAQGDHPAFAARWRGLDAGVDPGAAWFDPVTETPFPFDDHGHGTHTLGTILGKDGEHIVGMAWGAKWIAAGVIDRVGMDQTITDALATMQWTIDPDGNPATIDDVPDVVNNSWGVPGTDCEDTFWTAIDNAEAAGTIYVWAAGNEGPFGRSLRSPADRIASDFNCFAVGALKQGGNRITSFSSRGPSDCDRQTIKPEVSAVGENVNSAYPGGSYTTMDGTSMAAPHVTGAVALLRSVHPDAPVDEVKRALYVSATDLGSLGEDNDYGMGRIDLVGALGELGFGDRGGVRGIVTVKETGAPIPNAQVTFSGGGTPVSTALDGKYRFLVETPGAYTVTVTHPDYGTFPKDVEVAAGPWTVLDFELSNIPVADFTTDKTELCAGESVQFTSLAGGLVTAYVWSFGDGNISTERDPLNVYAVPGLFGISMYVGGPTGEDTKDVADMIAVFAAPAADFTASATTVKVGEEITFTDLSTGPATAWAWDFGDGTTATDANPVKSYDTAGTYSVSLTATNLCGEQATTKDGYVTVESEDTAGDDDDDNGGGCGC
jgi:PKD repeat protein